jgi:hypothetical protein
MFTVKSLLAAKPGRHRIEQGLYVDVDPGQRRRFVLRFVSPVTHRATEAGLGVSPATGLADARAKAAKYRAMIAKGDDPIIAKREKRVADIAETKAKTALKDAIVAKPHKFRRGGIARKRGATPPRNGVVVDD